MWWAAGTAARAASPYERFEPDAAGGRKVAAAPRLRPHALVDLVDCSNPGLGAPNHRSRDLSAGAAAGDAADAPPGGGRADPASLRLAGADIPLASARGHRVRRCAILHAPRL